MNVEQFIRPSRITQLDLCPAAAQVQAAVADLYPETTTSEAEIGTLAHSIGEWGVNRLVAQDGGVTDLEDVCRQIREGNGDASQLDSWSRVCVERYIRFIHALIAEHGVEPGNVLTEHALDGAIVGMPRGGKADCILVVPFRTVIVVDLKAGFLVQDSAEEHDQIMCYAVMASECFKVKDVIVYLFQARAEEADRASATKFDAAEIAGNAAWTRGVVKRARDPLAEARPSLAACANCRALPFCPAARSYIVNAQEILKDPIGPITDDEFGALADAAKLAEKFADAGLALVKTRITAGGKATGWEIGPERKQAYIEDAEACFNVCATSSSHASQFWKAVTVSRTELDKQFGSQRDRYRSLLKEKVIAGSLRKAK